MFLDCYGLAENPFAEALARPVVQSVSAREVATKLQRAAAHKLHCVAISGPSGIGKTTAVEQGLHLFSDWFRCWVTRPDVDEYSFLQSLLTEFGLPDAEGNSSDMRNILEVFLRHQVASKRSGLLVIDNLDEASPGVLAVVSWLMGLRLRGMPLLCLVLVARSDELVARLLPSTDAEVGVLQQHQKFFGFSLDDTRAYILECLTQAGCNDPTHLVTESAVARIQGFSQGIPARIDQLCAVALNALAETESTLQRRPRLSQKTVDNAAAMLRFKFDADALEHREEPLSREHVHQYNQQSLRIDAARLVVASGGQLVAEVSLNRPRMVLGRDANCDISLDSRYVSRYQNLFLQTDGGWLMIDLNSTNGSFVNGQRVREHALRNGDVIAVGNHQLRFFCRAPGRDASDSGTTAIRPAPLGLPPAASKTDQVANS